MRHRFCAQNLTPTRAVATALLHLRAIASRIPEISTRRPTWTGDNLPHCQQWWSRWTSRN